MGQTITAKDLLVTEGILTCRPEATLSQALAMLNSSHDASFVVSDKNDLLGVISPYYVLFHANYPPRTKVENCLFSPPKLDLETPVSEIARHMMESKVYFLPVMSQKKSWLGIVSIRSLMEAVAKDVNLGKRIQEPRRPRKVITINEKSTLNEARALLRNGGVSRLPVVDQRGKLVGILTRYDLREAFTIPKTSQRFLSRSGEKKKQSDKPIRNFVQKTVVTASHRTPVEKMLRQMLEKKIGSIIIVNNKWQPTNILTYRDILESVSKLEFEKGGAMTFSAPEDFTHKQKAAALLEGMFKRLVKRGKATRVEATIEVTRNRAEEAQRYETRIKTFHPKRRSLFGQASDYDWKNSLRDAMGKIEKQARRTKF